MIARRLRIDVACSDPNHPVNSVLGDWVREWSANHDVRLVRKVSELTGGDLLFLISFHEIVKEPTRRQYNACLVIHASALPDGRGWSPHVWQILEGKNEITVTLLEAAAGVDSGDIWAQTKLVFEGHELFDEINAALFSAEADLMSEAVRQFSSGSQRPRAQEDRPGTVYRRRTGDDSRLDPMKSLESQFDLLRVCDPNRFPAFVELRGHRYTVTIKKEQV